MHKGSYEGKEIHKGSVGQMYEHGYFLLFGDYKVEVYEDRKLTNLVVSVQQKSNRCFPLKVNSGK